MYIGLRGAIRVSISVRVVVSRSHEGARATRAGLPHMIVWRMRHGTCEVCVALSQHDAPPPHVLCLRCSPSNEICKRLRHTTMMN